MADNDAESRSYEPVEAGGGVIYRNGDRGPEVVLIFRRGVWDLPKGKKEAHESIPECAVREVAEEVGIRPPEIVAALGDTFHQYRMDGRPIGKITYWYAMETDPGVQFRAEAEEDIEEVRWFRLSEARESVGFDNLRTVLNNFDHWYTSLGQSE